MERKARWRDRKMAERMKRRKGRRTRSKKGTRRIEWRKRKNNERDAEEETDVNGEIDAGKLEDTFRGGWMATRNMKCYDIKIDT